MIRFQTFWALCSGLLLAACAAPPPLPAPWTPPAVEQASAPLDPVPREVAADPPEERTLLFPGSGNFVKDKAAPARGALAEGRVLLNYEGAEIREVVANILGNILKLNYTVHPAVQGTVTLRSSEPIAHSALLQTLETLLRQYGAALVKEGGLYKVMPATFAIRGSATAQLGSATTPLPRGLSIQVVPLKWVSAREMWKLLEPIVTDPTVMRIDDVRNFIILAGSDQELRHLLETIDLFDVDYLAGMSVGLFTLRSADAKAVAQEVSLLFGDLQQGPLAGVVRVIAVERLNGLLVVTTQPQYLEKARVWIERLDRTSAGAGGRRLHVYHMQYGRAENIAKLLNEIFGRSSGPRAASGPTVVGPAAMVQSSAPRAGAAGQAPPPVTPSASPAPGTGNARGRAALAQDVQVIADTENNAIVVLGVPEDFEVIDDAIKRLDIIQRQVLVEVTLAEFRLTGELQFGVEWFLNSRNGRNYVGRLAGSAAESINPPLSAAGVPGGAGLTLVRTLSGGQIPAILNLLETDGRARIVATPSTTVADNHPATIKVGTRVPVKTQSQTGAATGTLIEQIQYIETGVLLEVTPRINSNSQVTLEINVELSQARINQSSNIDSPEVSNRSAKSLVTIASGETVVMAGLIRQDSSNDSAGLPGLAKIPLIGGLFGTQSQTDVRTELVVLITPRVINDARQARDITEELVRKVPSLQDMLARPAPAPVGPQQQK
ncbi:MAG: type II secretion system secretin GspD [Burkholderiales bacterium]|nr:type II secretion system secretin GspD [Burkholderiales bacterium]